MTTDLLRRYARSPRGTRARDYTPCGHWQTHTVIAARPRTFDQVGCHPAVACRGRTVTVSRLDWCLYPDSTMATPAGLPSLGASNLGRAVGPRAYTVRHWEDRRRDLYTLRFTGAEGPREV